MPSTPNTDLEAHRKWKAKRAEQDRFRKKLHTYFCDYVKTHPEVTKPGPLHTIWGEHQDGRRVTHFCESAEHFSIEPFENLLPDPLIGTIYKIMLSFPGGGYILICAVYQDGSIFWLDDHTSNDGFNHFWAREDIHWQNAKQAVQFLLDTKFHFLPIPSKLIVLDTVDDIRHESFRKYLQESQEAADELQKYEAKLSEVGPKIYSPQLVFNEGRLALSFCVWTMVGGHVFSIKCHFESGSGWTHQSEQLAFWVGEAFIPR